MDFVKELILFGLIVCLSLRIAQSIPLMDSPSAGLASVNNESVIISNTHEGSSPDHNDSDIVENVASHDERFPVINSTSQGLQPVDDEHIPLISTTEEGSSPDDNVVESIPFITSTSDELSSDDDDTEVIEISPCHGDAASLITSISKGFPPDDDSDVVEITTNHVQEKEPDLLDLSMFGGSLYRIPDFNNTARLLEEYVPDKSSVNPEELGSYIEGDILIPQSSVILKNGLVSASTRWPNGLVPYEIAGNFNARDLEVISNAINQYHERTCIRFVPRTTQSDYISIVNDKSGCWSSIGRVGGRQRVNLQTPGCLSKPGTSIHELMHVLGFLHEQNREERDSFVSIQYQNIKKTAYENFKKMSRTAAFGVKYDYGSVMHYSSKAFSQNGQPTIVAMNPEGKQVMGQRNGFSPLDIKKINRMYNCLENAKPDEPPVNLTKLNESPFRPGRLIRNVLGNFISELQRVGSRFGG